jgi:hypothetical protein
MGGLVFSERLEIGERYENKIDSWAADKFGVGIKKVSLELQQLGIDRLWTKPDGGVVSVEYKADLKAHRTGNVFLELQSGKDKPGWVFYSIAQLLIYYIPGSEKVYLADMQQFKRNVTDWTAGKRLRKVAGDYTGAAGIPLPIAKFQADTGAKSYRI